MLMLALTENAIDAINELAPGEAGLRVFTLELPGMADQWSFQVEFADEPAPEDEVLNAGGANVFLEPRASTLLDDKVLDATREGASVRFAVFERR
jgi:iron-sulfur cluster assembly protein